jgi:hypothetical protein
LSITLQASAPATSDRAVVFACDGRYLPYALFAAARIAALHPARDFDICICALGETLSVPSNLAPLGMRVCRVETGGALAGLRLDARRTEAAYLRLALPAAFGGEYARLLYLDSDVFPQGGDWRALIGLDLGGRPIGAVRDNLQWRAPRRNPLQFRRLGLGPASYFNSGLMLIDVAAYNGQEVLERCLALAAARPDRLVGLDQELLNAVLHGDWAELSPVWNWQYTRASMLFEALESAHLVHFIGGKKPWGHTGGALPPRFRDAYRAFFAAHCPELPPVPHDGLRPHQNRRYLRDVLLRHYLAVGSFSDYLDRFETDLTVLRGR